MGESAASDCAVETWRLSPQRKRRAQKAKTAIWTTVFRKLGLRDPAAEYLWTPLVKRIVEGIFRNPSGSSAPQLDADPVFVGEFREFSHPGAALPVALIIHRGKRFMRHSHPVERPFIIALSVPDK